MISWNGLMHLRNSFGISRLRLGVIRFPFLSILLLVMLVKTSWFPRNKTQKWDRPDLKIHIENLSVVFIKKCSTDVNMKFRKPLLSFRLQVRRNTIQEDTAYVSHILMTFLILNSRIKRQFIHRKLNWMNSIPSALRWFANGASMRAINSLRVETILCIPGWAKI